MFLSWTEFGANPQNTHLVDGKGAMSSAPVQKWVFYYGDWCESGGAALDIDGDGRTEVVIASWSGYVDALDGATGSQDWRANIGDAWNSVPWLGDVDGDGAVDVFISSWGNGNLYRFRGSDGSTVWSTNLGSATSEASPKVGDFDGDGTPEVFCGAWYGWVACLNALTGTIEWQDSLVGDVDHAAAVADLDGDGMLEIVVGSDGGGLYCYSGTGAREWVNTSISGTFSNSSPAIGDVDADGELEVVVGNDSTLYVVNGATGAVERSLMIPGGSIESSPALANLDLDTALEIVVGSNNGNLYCLDGASLSQEWVYSAGYDVHRGQAIADIDGDGELEVIGQSRGDKVYCLDGATGAVEWTYTTSTTDIHDPMVADIDDDGCLEIVVGLASDSNNILALDDPADSSGCSPLYQDSEERSGVGARAFWDGEALVLQLGGSAQVSVKVYDTGGRLVRRVLEASLPRGEHRFSLAGLPKGTYFALVEVDRKTLRTALTIK